MNLSRNLQITIICLGAFALLAIVGMFMLNSSRPSDTVIKALIEKQMERRLKGGSIVSMKIIRGQSFPNQAHFSKVAYGTLLFPVVVHLTYNTKLKDGTLSDNQDLSRTLNFYKDATHHWVNDDQLH
jgi:hypothetical protein